LRRRLFIRVLIRAARLSTKNKKHFRNIAGLDLEVLVY